MTIHHDHDERRKTIIGWSEYVDLPEWRIHGMKAKVDTGAKSSALHVEDLEELPDGRIAFHVVLNRKKPARRVLVRAKIVKRARVRSSTGHFSLRYFVRTRAVIGHVEKEIDISLDSREEMVFRMLLGRSALERDFVVDVSNRSVLERPRRKHGKDSAK